MTTKNSKRQTKVREVIPTLDLDEFNALTDLLFEVFKENHAACARVLGISRLTWKKWEQTPPTWPYWNVVLRYVIKSYLPALAARRGITKKHHARIVAQLSQLRDGNKLGEEIGSLAYNLSGAEAHLRRLLRDKGMFWDQIRLPKYAGGYDNRTLRAAAKALGVVKSSEGYGENKRSYWRLPDQDDD